MPQAFDDLGRPVVADAIRRQIAQAFLAIPQGKRGALLVLSDTETGDARGFLAADLGKHWKADWKVAAGGGIALNGKRPSGYVGVEAIW